MVKAEINTRINSVTNIDVISRRESREWYDGRVDLEIKELIDSNARMNDAVVYTDGSVLRGRKSGWGFPARVRGRLCVEQSSDYPLTTANMRMEIESVTEALR